jgi:2-methylisocitrate lyase-like PEP mutase family enzyme
MSLKQRLLQDPAVLAAGAYDALSALLIERAGFEAAYVSGAGISYTQLGRPDLGLISFDQLADVTARIRERVALPLIVDGDTGFGNALNVQRVVRILEQRGANAIQLEDQTFPKRCGHLSHKSLVTASEMSGKIRAAVDARHDAATLIIARTDAIAVEGLEAALARAALYAESGADVLFVEAPRDLDEMKRIVAALGPDVPLLGNMVEGGVTPILSCDELSALGFRLVICPAALIRAQTHLAEHFLHSLKTHGSTGPWRERMLDFGGLNALIGIEGLSAEGARYDPAFAVMPAAASSAASPTQAS